MELLNKSMTGAAERPVKVLQFGEGNFLRGFVDYMIDVANEKGVFDGSIAIIKPIPRKHRAYVFLPQLSACRRS